MRKKPDRTINFTHTWLNEVAANEREVWYDESCPNLTVRIGIGKDASRVFYWFGRIAGRPSRLKIGAYPKVTVLRAREEARRITGEAATGVAPMARGVASRREHTLESLFEWYLAFHAKPHKQTWQKDVTCFERRLRRWAKWKVSQITRDLVTKLHVEVAEKDDGGPAAANKILELLGYMYRLAKEQSQIAAPDPTEGIKRFKKLERDRFLSAEEVGRFLTELDAWPNQSVRHFIYLALFTGARRKNVCAMRWDEIDLRSKTWRVSGKDAKGKTSLQIVLPPPVIALLKDLQATSTSPWVLPGTGETGHVIEPKRAMRTILKKAGISDDSNGLNEETHVRFHDLRRTLGSWQAMQGTSLIVIGKSLGHSSPTSTKVYAKLHLDPVREAVDAATASMMDAKKKSKKT